MIDLNKCDNCEGCLFKDVCEDAEKSGENDANRGGEVKVYRLNPDGTKGEFLRTDPAFPEGWDKLNNNIKNRRGENDMARLNWETLWPQVLELQAAGKSAKEIAKELEIDLHVLQSKIYREEKAVEKQTPRRKAATINPDFEAAFEKQTPKPAPEELGGTDPERESQEPAKNIIPETVTADDVLSPLARAGNEILIAAWEKIDAVVKDPIALPLIKELIRQGVA